MCARHPEVETGLSCGRCGTPICPRCLVYTPGGTRCPDCAMLRRPPMYEVAPLDYAKAVVAAAVVGVPLGVIGAFLPPSPFVNFFSILIAFFAGSGAGTLMAGAIARATNRKRGMPMQVIAAGGILLAAGVRISLAGIPLAFILRDMSGAVLVVVAISIAYGRLR